MKKNILTILAISFGVFSFVSGCSTPKTYQLPAQDQYQDYKIIDSVDKDTIFAKVDPQEKIAVVFRDISTTSYSFLEPRFNNSMVRFEGKSRCCSPDGQNFGNTGLVVYKFSFIGKGNTTINMVARQKGLSPTANSFETDHLYTVNVQVKD